MSQVDDYLSPELEACLNNAGQCVRSRGCPLVILCGPFTAVVKAAKAFRNGSSTPHRPCVQKESCVLVHSACAGAALLMACLGREHISAARAGQRKGPGVVRAAELFPHGPPRGSPALCPTRALQRTNRQWSTRPLVRSRRSRRQQRARSSSIRSRSGSRQRHIFVPAWAAAGTSSWHRRGWQQRR